MKVIYLRIFKFIHHRKRKAELDRMVREHDALELQLALDWTVQICLDTFMMILNDKEIMKKNVYGAERLKQICEEFDKRYHQTRKAIQEGPESAKERKQIEEWYARVIGEDYLRWEERYPLWEDHRMMR